jgi:hypothetical protein
VGGALIGDLGVLATLYCAKSLIRQRGLSKGLYATDGGFCIVGALMEAEGGKHIWDLSDPEIALPVAALCEALGDRFPGRINRSRLYRFNDAPETTLDDVIQLFDDAMDLELQKGFPN